LIFNILLLADDQFIISDTEDNLQKAVYLLYSISKGYNLETVIKKTKVFGFIGAGHLRTKIIINDETIEQVIQFNVNKNPTDATVCTYLFTAKLFYMFRVSQHPSSGVLKTLPAASGTGHILVALLPSNVV